MTKWWMRLNSWPCLLSCSRISVFGEYLQENLSQVAYKGLLIRVIARNFLTNLSIPSMARRRPLSKVLR